MKTLEFNIQSGHPPYRAELWGDNMTTLKYVMSGITEGIHQFINVDAPDIYKLIVIDNAGCELEFPNLDTEEGVTTTTTTTAALTTTTTTTAGPMTLNTFIYTDRAFPTPPPDRYFIAGVIYVSGDTYNDEIFIPGGGGSDGESHNIEIIVPAGISPVRVIFGGLSLAQPTPPHSLILVGNENWCWQFGLNGGCTMNFPDAVTDEISSSGNLTLYIE